MNKRYAAVSQRSYADQVNIFSLLFWLWGVRWVLTHVLEGLNTLERSGERRTLQHRYESTQAEMQQRVRTQRSGETVMLQPELRVH